MRVKTEGEITALTKERQRLYRAMPDSERIGQINAQLKTLRHTVRLCKDITVQSEEMERRMQADRQTAQRLREEQAQAHRGRKRKEKEWMQP